MHSLNLILAFVSIFFGLFGWLAPGYTMNAIGLQATNDMGPSEIRAASGALFVALGVGALIFKTPTAFAMMGMAWGGAAVGRLTSLILDGVTRQKLIFFVVEAGFAAAAIGFNLS